MDEEIVAVAQEQDPTSTATAEQNDASENDAAAAAFASARGEVKETPAEEIIEVEPEPEVIEEPKVLAGKTEKEIIELLETIPKYRKEIDDANGKYGKLNAALLKLQQEAPKGQPIEITDEDLAEMQEISPEFADVTKSALKKILGRINPGVSTVAQNPEEIITLARKEAETIAKTERKKTHIELLDGLSPGWEKVIGVERKEDGALGNVYETDWRKWLATQPEDYQDKILASDNAFVLQASIKSYEDAKAASAKKQQQNKSRLANAVTPSGVTAARGTMSEQAAAEAAFNANRRVT